MLLAFQSGDVPDILQGSAALAPTWSVGGFLTPLDDYIPRHSQFNDVVPGLWPAMKYNNKTWGIPQDTEARPLYFNKALLKRLGWTDQQIADLPQRVVRGDFTWDDVMTLSREARQKNIIEAGKGYYHRPFNGPDWVQGTAPMAAATSTRRAASSSSTRPRRCGIIAGCAPGWTRV